MMTFMEAKAALKELAGDKYHSLTFELTESAKYSEGTTKLIAKCKCYIDGPGWSDGCATWESALNDMAECIRMADHPENIPAMTPGEDALAAVVPAAEAKPDTPVEEGIFF